MARNSELIEGCAYYHCIFTLSFELNDLIYEKQRLLYNLMFSCVSDTLLTLCRDKKYMGVTKIMTLERTKFIELFLQHILPKGFSRVRFSGYLRNYHKTKKLKLKHKLRGTLFTPNPTKGMSMAELMLLIYHRDICVCGRCNGRVIPYPRGKPFVLPVISCSLT